MIITISGTPGSGKSTAAKLVAEKLSLKHHSIGDLMRAIASKRGVSLLELSKIAETDKKVDEELDAAQVELGKKEENFVIDSRLGFHFIPNSFKVFLKVDSEEAAERIFAADRVDEKENVSFEQTVKNIEKRKKSEKLRYEKFYGLDPFDEEQYDLVVDTTGLSKEQVVEQIVEGFKSS
ncbi:nucleoside monophosphate kinase [Candidatus Woesearchaeota archaeon]|nr:nucleoside monophosphate kinase [Candidatus Woesearchaeota archaeon]